MTDDDTPAPPTSWAYEYWPELADAGVTTEKRTAILDTVCALARPRERGIPAVLSATAMTDIVARELDDRGVIPSPSEYTRSQFNQVFPEFERLGVGYRIPKLHRDDQYYIFPGSPLSKWVEQTPAREYLTPSDEPSGYGTCLFGDYVTAQLDTVEPTAGTTLPLEAQFYTAVGMYAPIDAISSEGAHTFTPATVDVEVCAGDIETLRTVPEFELDALADQLALGTTLPSVDEEVIGGAHDVGMFGRVTAPVELSAPEQVERRLERQLEAWTASALALYAYPEAQQPDEDEETDAPLLSIDQFRTAVNTIAAQETIDHIDRYGLNAQVTVVENSDQHRVLFGIYRRTTDDTPLSEVFNPGDAGDPIVEPADDDDD